MEGKVVVVREGILKLCLLQYREQKIQEVVVVVLMGITIQNIVH
jgi:hypothetical protein